ncbi:MAG: hypothetical protein U0931_08460 [Vulcanimicrobiota bacterium]
MEVERHTHSFQTYAAGPAKAETSRPPVRPVVDSDSPPSCQSQESLACRVLFRRVPELLARMVSSSSEPGQVTLVFRLGYFDLAGISQARKEFYQETQAGLRIMVEVPEQDSPATSMAFKNSLKVKVTQTNLQQLARRASASVRVERATRVTTTAAASSLVEVTSRCLEGRAECPLTRNLALVVKGGEEQRKPGASAVAGPSPARRWLAVNSKHKKRARGSAAPNWLRRRELVQLQQRQIGPKATQNMHSAERQPHCLCPGCGREITGILLYCPECTMRAARYIQVPVQKTGASQRQHLVQLLFQAVAWR